MADREPRKSAWTTIADLFVGGKDGKTLSGEIRLAAPLTLTNGLDLVITQIPEANRKDKGPKYRASLVKDLGPIEKGSKGKAAGDDIPF